MAKKSDVFSTEKLVSWLETKPSEKAYCFMDNGNCLLAQYFRAHGFPTAEAGGTIIWLVDGEGCTELPDGWADIAADKPRTFGDALDRARATM